MSEKKTIMAIGAHIGDAELMCGGVLASASLKGDKIITVALTAGERGNPKNLTVEDYKKQKILEAKKFAKMLNGESIVFPYLDGELAVSEKISFELCDLIRKYKPSLLITHWKNSIHKDHEAAYKIVKDAQFYAGLHSISRVLPSHYAAGPYYAENWEDATDFKPYMYIEVSDEGFALWQDAIKNHWFAINSPDFKYMEYYSHLMAIRGLLSKTKYAQAFNIDETSKKIVLSNF